jgi:nucleoside-diphosphate-sugar epimerase
MTKRPRGLTDHFLADKKILVTGGAGFVGAHLVRQLAKIGAQVTVIDNFSRGSAENIQDIPRTTLVDFDLRHEQGLSETMSGNEVVFNLAALNTGIDYDAGRTQEMFENNMLLQMIPLRVAGQVSSVKKFIQISSASVYSRISMETMVPTPEEADTSNPEPSKLGYALAKKMGENLATWYAQNTSLQTRIVRFINVYGEGDHYDEKGHFIPMMTRKFLEAKKIVNVFGSGEQKRSFLHVDDAVAALLTIAEKGENGQPYNVDASEEHSVKEVVLQIQQVLKKDEVKVVFDLTKPAGSARRLLANDKLIKLGWKPKVSFQDGLKRTIFDIQRRVESK